MNVFKATFFSNELTHKIETIVCKKLTDEAVVIDRTIEEARKQHSNSPIIAQRETKYTRFCSTEIEAIDFIYEKYGRLIISSREKLIEMEVNQRNLMN